jgi:hypothetical protein
MGWAWGSKLQQLFKLLYRHSGVPDDTTHRESINRISARYDENPATIAHRNMFSLADNSKALSKARMASF